MTEKARKQKFRAVMSHCINGEQVNKTAIFQRASQKVAEKYFHRLRKADETIQEAGLWRVRDNQLIAEYVGYV